MEDKTQRINFQFASMDLKKQVDNLVKETGKGRTRTINDLIKLGLLHYKK
jgi:hypothetical protein